MADGAPLPSTVLTLSHWPASPTPRPLRRDLSADIAFAYMTSRRRWPRPGAATTDHFDQDGLVTLYALTRPEEALRRRRRLTEVAEAGDFLTCSWRDAARVSFAIAAYADPARSPIDVSGDNPGLEGELHAEVLDRIEGMVDRPERCRRLWEEEDAFLDESEAAVVSGMVSIEELPHIDLAVLTVDDRTWRRCSQFSRQIEEPCHPIAVHNATPMMRVLTLSPGRHELRFRYETWVRLVSRRPQPRVDLSPLAEELTAAETAGTRWTFNGCGATVARLVPDAPSSLDPPAVRDAVVHFLESGPPAAWDPEVGR